MSISRSTTTGPHALLIGVDAYRNFDGVDLKGSRNDVLLLARLLVEVLGVPAGNVHVLTTPAVTAEEAARDPNLRWLIEQIPPENRGEASERAVTERLARLLTFASRGRALLAFSGHGAATAAKGPVLCLGDAAPRFECGVLALKELGHDVAKAHAQGGLIALFDCCHVVATSTDHAKLQVKALPHELTPEDVAAQAEAFRVSDRVLLAARPGEPAYEMRPGLAWQGLFTFALATAAGQWKAADGVSHGAYKQVLKRARRTAKALGAAQKPQLLAPEARRRAIARQPLLGVENGPTWREPDGLGATPPVHQLDPDYFYTILDLDGSIVAQVVATGSRPPAVVDRTGRQSLQPTDPNTEYWYVDDAALRTLGEARGLILQSAPIPEGEPVVLAESVDYRFTCSEARKWCNCLAAPTSGANAIFGATTSLSGVMIYLLLNVVVDASGAPRLGAVQWYLAGLSGPPDGSKGSLQPGTSSGREYTAVAALPTDYWASASL